MKHRNVIARSFLLAGTLAVSATVAGSASALGPSYEHSDTCVQTAVAPGDGYRGMNVRFKELKAIPRQVAVAPGAGFRDSKQYYPYWSTSGGPGFRDMLVRFNGMDAKGNEIATSVKCPNLRVW